MSPGLTLVVSTVFSTLWLYACILYTCNNDYALTHGLNLLALGSL